MGLSITFWAASQSVSSFSIYSLFVFIISLFIGFTILYSVWFLIAASSIWFVKTWNATEVLRALLAAGRYPITAYPVVLRYIFTLVLPVAFLTTFPAEAILGELKLTVIFFGLVLSIIFFVFSRFFWKYALRYYTSASS